MRALEYHFRRGIGAVADLVFQALEMDRVDRAVRTKARHDKTRQSAHRLRQHQKGVAHRRRHEPFLAGDDISLAVAFGARGVGAHVGAALTLRHAHADGHAALVPPRREGRIVTAGAEHRHDLRAQCRICRQRAHRGARHGDRAQMSGLDLRRHKEFCRPHHFGRIAGRLACRRPGRAMQPGARTVRHQFMIRRVEFDLVAAIAARIERFQLRRIVVGEAAALGHRARAPEPAELRQFGGMHFAAKGGDRLRQRRVRCEQIGVLKRRRLIERLVGLAQDRHRRLATDPDSCAAYAETEVISRTAHDRA